MNLATIAGIILVTIGTLLTGMAALIKSMLFGKLADLKESIDEVRTKQAKDSSKHTSEIEALKVDVAQIKTRHEIEDRHGLRRNTA